MKTILIGLCILGLAHHTNDQKSLAQINDPILEEAIKYPTPDLSYANTVYNKELSAQIKDLQTTAGNYDVRTNPIFSNSYGTYEVLFETTEGSIIAIYNDTGKLVNTIEKFNDVKLPEVIRKTLCKEYSDWKLNATSYRVNYCCHKPTRKVCHIQLKKGHKRVNLKIDCQGNILKSESKRVA